MNSQDANSSAAAAKNALRNGHECLQAGEKSEAIRWLDRAHRLAPDDPFIRLLFATALADIDEPYCHSLLKRLLEDYPQSQEARIASSAAALRRGEISLAVQQMAELLSSNAPPHNSSFHQLANQLARISDTPGWVGADCRGRLYLQRDPSLLGKSAEFRLDGQTILSRQRQAGDGALQKLTLPTLWKDSQRLSTTFGGRHFLGSPIDLAALRRLQGFVEMTADGGLQGWATHPADPSAIPLLLLLNNENAAPLLQIRADDETSVTSSEDSPGHIRGFAVPAKKVPPVPVIRIVGPDGKDILGSPIYPFAEHRAARAAAFALRGGSATQLKPVEKKPVLSDNWRPLPAMLSQSNISAIQARREIPRRAQVDIVIPVYRGASDVRACLNSLRRKQPAWARIVVVDDASPDRELREMLHTLSRSGVITLLSHDRNLGFPTSANTGLRHAAAHRRKQRDVVLLNSDTLLPPGWLERMVSVAYGHADIGSVTPMTNEGTILSYPSVSKPNPTPDLSATDQIDQRLRAANGKLIVDLPTAVGFCMFIRHDCLQQVGLFREDAFAQGYGEENDWSMRARHLGWRHVAATGVFVAHVGGRSFGAAKRHLLARNADVLNRLHPGYDALIAAFTKRDPLAEARFRADARAWAEARSAKTSVVLITHNAGGGVERFITERCAALRAVGKRPIVLRPTTDPTDPDAPNSCLVSDDSDEEYPNLRFRLPQNLPALLDLLQADRPELIEIHHLLGHAPDITSLSEHLALPYDIFIHDYAFWCPRITLCTKGPRYCGEPLDVDECEACVMDVGRRTTPDIPVVELRATSAQLLMGAKRVVVSCEDVATRIARQFRGIRPTINPWEDDQTLTRTAAPAPHALPKVKDWRVLIVGAIGTDKGYDVLLGCVRDARKRNLNLSFIVAGYTMDDGKLMDSGPIFITGAFEEAEAISLASAQRAHVGFVPSIWPETWCYTLSTLWRAGLQVAAFAFGAQAQRISRTGRGVLLPVGLAPTRINDSLIHFAEQTHGPASSRQQVASRARS